MNKRKNLKIIKKIKKTLVRTLVLLNAFRKDFLPPTKRVLEKENVAYFFTFKTLQKKNYKIIDLMQNISKIIIN